MTLNFGVLDENLFGPPLLATFPLAWRSLKPIAMKYRAEPRMPIYSDIEYVVYRYAKGLSTMNLKPYTEDFHKQLGIEDLPDQKKARNPGPRCAARRGREFQCPEAPSISRATSIDR